MKRILINATQAEELRVAMVNGQKLYDLDIEVPSREQKKSNIYKAKVTRVEPSLEAVFVNYGADRHGFLPFKEISKQYFGNAPRDDNGKPLLKDVIKVDQEIIVQVEKEERGNKGAALTSFISLAGRFLVAMPQNPKAGGVSRRIEGEDRDELKKVLADLTMPEGMGVIVRTAGVGRSTEELQWDLDYLTQVWTAIEAASEEQTAPFLIYQESDIVIRALRDHYRNDVGEIIIDSESAYKQAHDFMSMVMPGSLNKLKKFDEKIPLFNRFQIESQIESAFSREVTLPSGGAIVIDHTEALTSIDINSARATKGSDIEETAKNTNLEAADEVARQLRIRDLGGLIVIDFIDMMQNKNQREVETRLRNAVYEDRARVQIGRISRFGLLEMSRQRLRPSLEESSQIVCPRCSGQGTIRDVESLSLAVLRLLEDESLKDHTGKILAKMPVECATYLLNEKREKIDGIEQRLGVHIVVIPDPKLETPHYEIERVKDNDTHRHESNYKKSYELTTEEEPVNLVDMASRSSAPSEVAAVKRIEPPTPRPQSASEKTSAPATGLVGKLMGILFGSSTETIETKSEPTDNQSNNRSNRGGNRSRRGKGRNNPNRQRNTSQNKPAEATSNSQAAEGEQPKQEKTEGSENKRSANSRSGRSRNNRSGGRNNRSRQQDNRAPKDSVDVDGNVRSASDDSNQAAKSDKPASTSNQRPAQSADRNDDSASKPSRRRSSNRSNAQSGQSTDNAKGTSEKSNDDSKNNTSKAADQEDNRGNVKAQAKPVTSAAEKSDVDSKNSTSKAANQANNSGNVKAEAKPATSAVEKPPETSKPEVSASKPAARSENVKPVSDSPSSEPAVSTKPKREAASIPVTPVEAKPATAPEKEVKKEAVKKPEAVNKPEAVKKPEAPASVEPKASATVGEKPPVQE